jgi:hypothetical protein
MKIKARSISKKSSLQKRKRKFQGGSGDYQKCVDELANNPETSSFFQKHKDGKNVFFISRFRNSGSYLYQQWQHMNYENKLEFPCFALRDILQMNELFSANHSFHISTKSDKLKRTFEKTSIPEERRESSKKTKRQ